MFSVFNLQMLADMTMDRPAAEQAKEKTGKGAKIRTLNICGWKLNICMNLLSIGELEDWTQCYICSLRHKKKLSLILQMHTYVCSFRMVVSVQQLIKMHVASMLATCVELL